MPDVNRDQKYAEKFGVKEGILEAAHIIMLNKHPDEWKEGDDEPHVISLKGISPYRLYMVLRRLAEELREEKIPNLKGRFFR